jgi:hypothetical protein
MSILDSDEQLMSHLLAYAVLFPTSNRNHPSYIRGQLFSVHANARGRGLKNAFVSVCLSYYIPKTIHSASNVENYPFNVHRIACQTRAVSLSTEVGIMDIY